MMSARYELFGEVYDADTRDLYSHLAQAYEQKVRPLCRCRDPEPGVPMYIARFDGRFLIKRMPGTAGQHKLGCDSYDYPPELSGLGDVEGSAIVEDLESGQVTLKFGFALSKGAARKMPEPSGKEPDSIKADSKKLTLRGTLHYLWEQAGLNRWSPAMAGKRSWYVVRKYLLQAAADKQAKRMNLTDMLYIPESFVLDQKDQIQQRRTEHLTHISVSESGEPHFILVIGELKEIATARFGFKLVLKHLPDYGLMLEEATHKRLKDRFEVELELWNALEGTHLMVIATASLSRTGIATVQECSLMLTTEQWIPFDDSSEHALLQALVRRRYVKCLRYNLPSSRPLASAVLTDVEQATALYVVPPSADEAYQTALDALLVDSELDAWIWKPLEGTMPALPDPATNWRKLVAAQAARASQHDAHLPFDGEPPHAGQQGKHDA
ncbi:DUF1173 domain-containing protein [Burkholderia cenocepacia]|uniref:DUF1173 domain-containing protein n=1 Tax=Burkholderia cenocepacia (strain ATCC BAA-245 / DSM 16553 / LMG 16656 / NCTC 13227 / J2315 / CF5610) TaxID=216591 RepID=B4EQQ0_BURCJ|nr:DUF1173 domain-containing protein [Burkholderia cenocepacia]CAR57723.1 conserved hypothetical protein [Burkholderia cenocepacia J2315]KKI81725.1 hypothetical protein WQ49_14370 [Burkholderia cenocepacia]ONR59025.1 hypothetical protein A8E17_15750 [Burkholderia cenocepacia]ONR90520.1 hypothetical protein A8E20_36685 [Burkholderia cenocepacia]ONS13152.1 hypothetical protein A8E21_14470 [Burkholderia cenocepacia]